MTGLFAKMDAGLKKEQQEKIEITMVQVWTSEKIYFHRFPEKHREKITF